MSFVEWTVTYVISWWITLFVVLPFWVKPSASPVAGQALSAPEHPQLRRKFKITSILALIPTLIVFSIMEARASVYHAGSNDCEPLEAYHAPADLAAKDTDATLNAHPMSEELNVESTIDLPITNYVNAEKFNADLSQTEVTVGKINLAKDGSVLLNGRNISSGSVIRSGCIQRGE